MKCKLMMLAITVFVLGLGIQLYICVNDAYAICVPYPECLDRPPEPPRLFPFGSRVYPIDPPICVGCGCSGEYFDEEWVDFHLPSGTAYRKVRFFVTWYCPKPWQTLRIHDDRNEILLEGECMYHIVGWTGFMSTDVARLWIYPCGAACGGGWGWVRFDSLEFVETLPENVLKSSTTERRFELCGNYPNPFNPETRIKYSLAEGCQMTLSIYNVRGQRVRVLVNEFQAAGRNSVVWDGKNEDGHEVASGIYFYRLDAGDFTDTKSMVLLK